MVSPQQGASNAEKFDYVSMKSEWGKRSCLTFAVCLNLSLSQAMGDRQNAFVYLYLKGSRRLEMKNKLIGF